MVSISGVRTGGGGGVRGSNPPPLTIGKNQKPLFMDRLAFFRTEIVFFCAVSNCLYNLEKLSLWCNNNGSQTFLVCSAWTNCWLKMQAWTRSVGTKAGVVLWCHKDIVLNGYGWTRQRFSAEGILGRERLQLGMCLKENYSDSPSNEYSRRYSAESESVTTKYELKIRWKAKKKKRSSRQIRIKSKKKVKMIMV